MILFSVPPPLPVVIEEGGPLEGGIDEVRGLGGGGGGGGVRGREEGWRSKY